ncbi:hypothetical protein [Pseudoramibacter sp.]|jgi:hypothetical protein|uniref:hypothetical protein n=1 Tax=Pseudoramibacter sp. TaxID=2034862 RepID=UPI0025E78BDD|nr:hypothetical protein [Pseudoramibacter sp.]MCH4072752.1 hypothetical protein [Pseudoramibacter sp.]MCH4106523.1 hypothetical protein [Pseudoramibacter sp.]
MEKISTFRFHSFTEIQGQTYAVFIDEDNHQKMMKVMNYDDEGERHLIFQPDNQNK